ncbi:hypothetical protein FKP32DRAFT_876183 [Trametes sanguinea]|nr:hypothetical protein FKP32DRAFT_876183 [Trametes sanguinea]
MLPNLIAKITPQSGIRAFSARISNSCGMPCLPFSRRGIRRGAHVSAALVRGATPRPAYAMRICLRAGRMPRERSRPLESGQAPSYFPLRLSPGNQMPGGFGFDICSSIDTHLCRSAANRLGFYAQSGSYGKAQSAWCYSLCMSTWRHRALRDGEATAFEDIQNLQPGAV